MDHGSTDLREEMTDGCQWNSSQSLAARRIFALSGFAHWFSVADHFLECAGNFLSQD